MGTETDKAALDKKARDLQAAADEARMEAETHQRNVSKVERSKKKAEKAANLQREETERERLPVLLMLLNSLPLRMKFAVSKLNSLTNKLKMSQLLIKREKPKLIWLLPNAKLELLKLKLMKLEKIWNANENAKLIARERWPPCLINLYILIHK